MRRVLSEEHPDTLRSMNNLATVYQARGKLAQAEPLYTQVLETQRRVLGPAHPDTQTGMNNLALALLSQRKYAQAEALLREATRTLEITAPDSWRRYNMQNMLGGSVAGLGKYGEAEPLLVSGYEGMIQRAATIPSENRSALEEAGRRIVQLYQSWGRPEKVAEWTQKLRRVQ